jgi:hypothetical protein
LIIYGAGDLEIPITNSHKLFERALLAINSTKHLGLRELVKGGIASRAVIPNEAIIYKSIELNKLIMVELEHAGHNDGK